MARTKTYSSSLLLAFCLWSATIALEVTPRSPCALKCIDQPTGDIANSSSSSTYSKDLFCNDWEVLGSEMTPTGQKFKECNNCLKSSGFASDSDQESDRGWFLFNLRGVKTNPDKSETVISKHCSTRCNKIYNTADYQIKSNSDSYNFCDSSGNFTSDAEDCLACIYEAQGLTILGNALATVMDMCKKKPGRTYDFPKDQEIFAATKITFLDISASSSPSASPTSLSSTSPTSPPPSSSNSLSVGALAGIILGGLAGTALILCGILLLFRRRKSKVRAKTMAVEVNTHSAHSGVPPSYRYEYSPAGHTQKDVYAFNTELDAQHQTMELPTQTAPSELPAVNMSPVK
ncbi:hypothetical protein DE146DRAFT_766584 [Phaeosphaeria sp. MPI-PUGE-AT-0046c]|nr:hypothetical protein DE146DRAFT_766584 [Phaeosphaeria sp. MPI-PUGE-AT-0046c]